MTQNLVSRRSVLTGGLAGAATLALPAPALAASRHPSHGAYDVVDKSVTDVLQALRNGRTTSRELVDSYLARIEAYDGNTGDDTGLNAIVTRNQAALELAACMDAERRKGRLRGVLHGVPIIVKDNYLTQDMPTSAGSIALATYQSHHDSTVVERLRAAGAIILAKANMSEFAWHGTYTLSSVRGTTHNAFDHAVSSSGSSGGSAVAVAASFAPAAFGTDSCGSIIGPSAHSSSVGFRPTMGRISVDGIVPLSVRQDVAGPIARTVADAALLAQVVAGYDRADAQTAAYRRTPNLTAGLRRGALRGRRIGYLVWTRAQWDALNTAGHPRRRRGSRRHRPRAGRPARSRGAPRPAQGHLRPDRGGAAQRRMDRHPPQPRQLLRQPPGALAERPGGEDGADEPTHLLRHRRRRAQQPRGVGDQRLARAGEPAQPGLRGERRRSGKRQAPHRRVLPQARPRRGGGPHLRRAGHDRMGRHHLLQRRCQHRGAEHLRPLRHEQVRPADRARTPRPAG